MDNITCSTYGSALQLKQYISELGYNSVVEMRHVITDFEFVPGTKEHNFIQRFGPIIEPATSDQEKVFLKAVK